MSIQGMSQGLAFSNMSYYMNEEIPAITACDTPPLLANGNQGVYNTSFDMGTASGAGIIVFEVGYPRNDSTTTQPIMYALGDKLEWKYAGNYSSEYSFAQVGEAQPTAGGNANYVDDTGASRFRLMGRGYARGLVGTGFNPDGTPVTTRGGVNSNDKGTNKNLYGNKSTPLNPYVGSKLLPRTNPVTTWTQPYLVDPSVALSTAAGAFTTQAYDVCDTEFSTGGTTLNNGMQSDLTVYPGTKAAANSLSNPNSNGLNGNEVMTFGGVAQHNGGTPTGATNLSQHGSFVSYVQSGNFGYSQTVDGVLTYDWTNGIPIGSYGTRAVPAGSSNNANLVKQFTGPYTGHDEPEIANPFSSAGYAGSSAITLDYGRYAMRQGMMVVPVGGGGIVRCRLEAPFAGTFAEQKIFCPITLPKWGGLDNKMGYLENYTNAALHTALFITNGASQSASDHTSTNGSSATTTLSMATNNFNKSIKVNHLITGTGIVHGTIVTNVLDQVDQLGSLVGGTGYSVGNGIATSPTPSGGTGLTLNITAITANVTTFNVTNTGSNYNTVGGGTGVQGTSTGSGVGFTCGFFVQPGSTSISNVVMSSGGSGHVVGNVLQIVETSNTGAGNTAEVTVTAINSAGVIAAVAVNATGTGYDVNDVLAIAGGGSNATVTVTRVYYELTLSIAATISDLATINFHRSKLRESFDTYNELKLNLGQSPEFPSGSGTFVDYYDINNTSSSSAPTTTVGGVPTGQRGTGHFFNLFSGVAKIKPYATAAHALAHWGGNAHGGKTQSKTAYHVPSQNAIYRGQGYPDFKAGGSIGANSAGGGPESNHGHHVLSNHGSRPLAWNTLNSTDALAHHGIVNEADWVFTRSNGAIRSRLPATGIIDMTKYGDNDWDTVGGWYAMQIGSNAYAVQVGSLDYSRGEITVDVIPATSGTSGTVPRNGVTRTVTT